MVSTSCKIQIMVLISLMAISSALPGLSSAAPLTDPISLYNQACDSSIAGNIPEALAIFEQAMQAGFDDLRFAQTDPDLKILAASPEFRELVIAHQSNLTLLSSERGFHLQNGQWSERTELESGTKNEKTKATVRLKWQPLGLDFEIRVAGDLAAAFDGNIAPPADGGPSVLITLAVKDGTSPYESANSYHFLFGKNKTKGTGALFLPQLPDWQPISELTPIITSIDKGKSALITGTISWQIILPYHPLVDTTMGLNIAVQADASGSHSRALFPDPQVFTPNSEIHRLVPLSFQTNTAVQEAMVGKLSNSLAEDQPLSCNLTAISSEAGTGYLKMDFLDDQGNSVLSGEAQPQPLELVVGVNRVSRTVDFSALRLGPYLVKIELELPSDEVLVWSSLVLNIGPDWEKQFTNRIEKQSILDQPTANFYFETITSGIENLAIRRHPGSLTTTVLELVSLLDAGEGNGSILPASGVFILVWTDEQGRQRFISLYLPVGYDKAESVEPVVLWAGAPGSERRMATRIGKFCEYPRPASGVNQKNPIYLVPHFPTETHASLEEEIVDLRETLSWVCNYFGVDQVALAGTNASSGAVLQFSLQNPETLSRMLVFSGAHMEPWPDATAAELQKLITPKPAAFPPLTWIDFPRETEFRGQGKLVLSVLDKAGYIINPVQEIKGGPSMTQVTDRLVLWAE